MRNLQQCHDIGQYHGSKGVYNPPNGTLYMLITWDTTQAIAENNAYRSGYKNGKNHQPERSATAQVAD